MSTEFASADLTIGQVNAIVKKLGGHDMALSFLRDELSVSLPSRSWREEDDVIYFDVTSDGTIGDDWINLLREKGFHLSDYAKIILRSNDFKPTCGVTTEVAVLKSELFENTDRTISRIRASADKREFSKPNVEVACLIRMKFTDNEIKAMGLLFIVAMHEPYKGCGGSQYLLSANRGGDGQKFNAFNYNPDLTWFRGSGFAFAKSQVGPQH